MKSETRAQLRDLAIANRILAEQGVLDAFGHVSLRDPEDPSRYYIARSLAPEQVTIDDLQLYTLQNESVDGDARTPYAERAIHGGVYEARPEVLAVCHNHAPGVIPFGITGVPLRPVFHMAGRLGGDIPVWDIAAEFGDGSDLLVKTVEHGRSLARTLGPRPVALMRGHGSVVAAPSLRGVVMSAVYLERNAQLQMQALAMGAGNVHYLSDAEIATIVGQSENPLGLDRSWNCWRDRVQLPPE
jgi:HCOMODA/2-hydroxy-3-carboxy-muconic semialdehyde decarboxylase